MQNGVVSVVIPVYNGGRFLAGAVACARGQNVPVEVIVVDDGSTDNTARIASGLDIVYIWQENAGPAAARNRGIEAARGEFIACLDVDDFWTPRALPLLCGSLQEFPQAEIAQGHMQYVRMQDGRDYPVGPPRRSTQVGTMLFRAPVFGKVGLFDETLRYGEDTDWFLRAAEKEVVFAAVDNIVLMYRVHEQSTTHGRSDDELNVVQVLRSAIRRRRAQRDS